jgi:hypothetical protein
MRPHFACLPSSHHPWRIDWNTEMDKGKRVRLPAISPLNSQSPQVTHIVDVHFSRLARCTATRACFSLCLSLSVSLPALYISTAMGLHSVCARGPRIRRNSAWMSATCVREPKAAISDVPSSAAGFLKRAHEGRQKVGGGGRKKREQQGNHDGSFQIRLGPAPRSNISGWPGGHFRTHKR